MYRIKLFSIIFSLLAASAVCAAGEYVVIVNNSNPITELAKSEARNIFLGKKTTWANGQKIDVVVLSGGKTHEAFCSDVINKTPSQFSTFWKTALFTGTGTPPRTAGGDSEIMSIVKRNPAAIGYINGSAAADGVKVVTGH